MTDDVQTEPLPEHDEAADLLVGEPVGDDPDYTIDTAAFDEDDYPDDEVDLDPALLAATPIETSRTVQALRARTAQWFPAPAIVSLQRALDRNFPRRTRPDWILGDLAHSARESDHNPDPSGMVHAIDIRLGGGLDVARVLRQVIGDPRVWYVIHNHVIYSRTYNWEPRRYTGANPHTTHIHVSFRYLRSAEQDTSGWGMVKRVPKRISLSAVRRQFRIADGVVKGKISATPSVRRTQAALNARIGSDLVLDGLVGKKTLAAYRRWESRKKVPGRGRETVPDRKSLPALVEPKWKVVE